MLTKTCARCKETKALDEFYPSKSLKYGKDGYDYYCKYCRNGTHLKSRHTNKKRCSLEGCDKPNYSKNVCRTHYERIRRNGHTDAVIALVNKEKNKEYHIKYKYNMTWQEFEERSANGCEICGYKPERNLQVDHDHNCCASKKACGKCNRGVICNSCNQAVDKMEDGLIRPDYPKYNLIKQYLEAYNGKKRT